MMDIFVEAKRIVRSNPNEFKAAIDGIAKQLSKAKTEPKLMNSLWDCWRDSIGNDLIVLAWLLSDSAIGHGEPGLDKRIIRMLLARPQNKDGKHIDDKNVNPWNIVQDWTKAVIFYQEDSKTRLADAIRAYTDQSQQQAVQKLASNSTNGGGNAAKKEAIEQKGCWHNQDYTSIVWYGTSFTFNKTQGRVMEYLWENETASQESIGEHIACSTKKTYRLMDTFRSKVHGFHEAWGKVIIRCGKGLFSLKRPKERHTKNTP